MTTAPKPRSRGIRIVPRDIAVLSDLGTIGLLDSQLLKDRHWPHASLRACQQRLRLYGQHGLVQVIKLDVVSYGDEQGGRAPYLYALTPEGADVVARSTGFPPKRVLSKRLKPMTLLHRRDLSFVRLAWDDACQMHGLRPSKWIMDYDTRYEAKEERKNGIPNRLLYDRFDVEGCRLICCPDAAALTYIPNPTCPGASTELLTIWEVDRGTEGLKQVRQKLPGLALLVQRQAYRRYLAPNGEHVVRVLWACKNATRAETLRATFENDSEAASFRFASMEAFQAEAILTSKIWTDVTGRCRSIIASPRSSS